MVPPLGLKMASFQAWLWEFLDRLQQVLDLVEPDMLQMVEERGREDHALCIAFFIMLLRAMSRVAELFTPGFVFRILSTLLILHRRQQRLALPPPPPPPPPPSPTSESLLFTSSPPPPLSPTQPSIQSPPPSIPSTQSSPSAVVSSFTTPPFMPSSPPSSPPPTKCP